MPVTYDVKISYTNGQSRLAFPKALSVALEKASYSRAKITVTGDGILITPYVGDKLQDNTTPITLPDWT